MKNRLILALFLNLFYFKIDNSFAMKTDNFEKENLGWRLQQLQQRLGEWWELQWSKFFKPPNLDLPDYHFTETIYYTATKKSAVENCAANGDTLGPVITSCELN